jgi:mRNA interferase RelE/StbE
LAWTIEYHEAAIKDLKKLDRQVQREILNFMEKRIGQAEGPRSFGKPLRHSKFGLWRYRLRRRPPHHHLRRIVRPFQSTT